MLVVIFARDPTALRLTLLLSIFVTSFTARLHLPVYVNQSAQTLPLEKDSAPSHDPRIEWLKKLNTGTQRLIQQLEFSLQEAVQRPATKSVSTSTSYIRSLSDNGPFDRLPMEITTVILDEVVRDFEPIKVGELDEGRLSIILTCRLWADIFFSNPLWWTAVETHSRMGYGDERKLRAVLKRSGNLPLDLILEGWSYVPGGVDLLRSQAPRLRTLASHNTSTVDRALESIVSLPLPQLKTFKLSQNLNEDIKLNAPLLEGLKFVGSWDGYRGGTLKFVEGSRPTLRNLRVERNWDDFIHLLRESSQSIQAFTAIDLGSQKPCPINRIVLPALTTCHLQGHASWSTFLMMDARNLENITFVNWDPESEPILPLKLLPSARTVEWSGKLQLLTFIYNESGDLACLKRILRSITPSIQKLVLNHNEPYRHAVTDVVWHTPANPGLISVLCSPGICPELQELHIRGRTWLTVPDIQSIVTARQGILRRVVVERVGRGEHTSEEIRSAMEWLLEELDEIHIPSADQWVVSAGDIEDEQ
ncbi:hypothetical protein FRC04_000590 [Tulasnella sp. 424]|nr:hypothetical protein FRC04_000590 [Tulasnella sp. 424]KAG8967893.1 hypothetical protein FRC05_001858 [Tulasnella sp. 425]